MESGSLLPKMAGRDRGRASSDEANNEPADAEDLYLFLVPTDAEDCESEANPTGQHVTIMECDS